MSVFAENHFVFFDKTIYSLVMNKYDKEKWFMILGVALIIAIIFIIDIFLLSWLFRAVGDVISEATTWRFGESTFSRNAVVVLVIDVLIFWPLFKLLRELRDRIYYPEYYDRKKKKRK